MTLVQLNDVSLQCQKSEGQQQHNDDNGPAYDPNIPSFDDVPFIRRCTNCEMYQVSAPVACGDDDNTTVNWSYQDLRTLMSPYVG
jgi:hypothetical protein